MGRRIGGASPGRGRLACDREGTGKSFEPPWRRALMVRISSRMADWTAGPGVRHRLSQGEYRHVRRTVMSTEIPSKLPGHPKGGDANR
jgi:hypothetical protein